jgi:hypothetical protein
MANQHSSRQSWVAADMRPVRNSRQHLAASTNENRRQSPRTLQEKSRAPLLSGNPHIGKRPPHTDSDSNACPPPHQSQPTATNSLVALAGKMVHQSITMAPDLPPPIATSRRPRSPRGMRPWLSQARRDTRNGSRRDDKHAPAGPEYHHADRPAGCLEGEAGSALRRKQTSSADPRRTSGIEGLSPKFPSNLDISDFGHSGRPLGRV